MTLATSALALYHRTKAQFRQLTHPTARLHADHNHLQHPFTIAFPTHRTPGPRRRRHPRLLTTAIRHLLAAYSPASLPPPPLSTRPTPPASLPPRAAPPRPAAPVSASPLSAAPRPASPVPKKPPCRLCEATTQSPPVRRRSS